MRLIVLGANSGLARNFVFFLKKLKGTDVSLKLYDIQDHYLDGSEYDYTTVDFLKKESLSRIDFSADAVYLFSGMTGATRGFSNYNLFVDVNEKVLLNVLDELARQNAQCKFIYPSSRLVYGEDEIYPLHEDDVKIPKSVYAIQKLSAEHYIQLYHRAFGIEYVILRIGIPFGVLHPVATTFGIVGNLISQANEKHEVTVFGKGDGVRTFTHIEDLSGILLSCAETAEISNDVFNVGGHTYTIKNLSEKIAQEYGAKINFVEWPRLELIVETTNGWLNSDKLDAILHRSYKDIFE